MADLSRRPGAERGQILLIAAFTLAVIFVALALVVNSAIFTENLASRGEVDGSSEALGYQHQVQQSIAEAIRHANVYDTADLSGSLSDSVEAIALQGGSQQALAGQVAHASLDGWTDGSRIADNASGGTTFTSGSGAARWELADGVEGTRNFVVSTAYSDLPGPTDPPFTVVANESGTVGNVWTLEVHTDGATNAVLTVQTADGDVATCEHDVAGEFQIDVTAGVVDGERCPALTRNGPAGTPMWFATGVPDTSTYDVWFENGDQVVGSYSLVVEPRSSWNGTNLADGPAAGSPFRTDAIYSATVEYVYHTVNVDYAARFDVLPGEPP